MKTLLFVVIYLSGIGLASAQAQDCCDASGMKKYCMKYCQKSPKDCQKFCEKYCMTTCGEEMVCCVATTAYKTAAPASVLDSCHTFGERSHHEGMMTVYRFYCLDSINFSVRSMRDMPYNCMGEDSMWFEVCLHRRDGRTYSTEVRAVTNQGEISFPITMQAPAESGVESDELISERVIVYPNPASGSIRIPLDKEAIVPTSAQIIDMQGRAIVLQVDVSGTEAIIPTAGLASGTYHLILKSGGVVYGVSDFILVR